MSGDMLFDGYPDPSERPKKTAGQRRKERQQAIIDSGFHPLTRLPLANNGKTCQTCVHCVFRRYNHAYPKCDQTSMSSSEASDCRAGWPACISYKEAS